MQIILQKISYITEKDILIPWGVTSKRSFLNALMGCCTTHFTPISKTQPQLFSINHSIFSFQFRSKGQQKPLHRRYLFKEVFILEGIFRKGFYSTGASTRSFFRDRLLLCKSSLHSSSQNGELQEKTLNNTF